MLIPVKPSIGISKVIKIIHAIEAQHREAGCCHLYRWTALDRFLIGIMVLARLIDPSANTQVIAQHYLRIPP
jgi:hypothetical protein